MRFAALAQSMPDLLTPQEESLWALIRAKSYFWTHYPVSVVNKKGTVVDEQWLPYEIIPEHLHEHWPMMTSGKSFDIMSIPNEIGKKIPRPANVPATRPQFNEPDDQHEIILEDDPEMNAEVLAAWLDEMTAHMNIETETIQTKQGPKTIKKIILPSMEKQEALFQKAIKIKEKKHGA